MVELQSIFKKAYWSLAAAGLLYVTWVYLMTFSTLQRIALYANIINPAIWQDLNEIENFGFLKTQVQPFELVTPDNITLYGWHILPLHICREHEELLNDNWSYGPAKDHSETIAYKLLAEDPNARVVVNFHGNAAHLGSMIRPEMYRMALSVSTPQNPVHVFAIDYRGFGYSTGSPTEEGIITDGLTLLNHLTAAPLSVSPSRIVISGLSLGTAVTSAVAERFAFGSPESALIQPALKDPEPFAGIIVLASFSSVPNLIDSYSMKGLTPPMLSPLIGYPRAQKWVKAQIVDTWHSDERLARLTSVKPQNNESDTHNFRKGCDVTIIHARDDVEIPWREGFANWQAATGPKDESGMPTQGKIVYERIAEGGLTETRVWEKDVLTSRREKVVKRVRWEKVGYGGHNRVGAYSVAALAILRSFEE